MHEEVARFLDIPGGEQIVKESYAQMRKFNCWNISIVQQYAASKKAASAPPYLATAASFSHAPERSRRSRRHGADIGLTEVTKHAILSYPLPDQQTGEKFSAFTYLHNDAQNPICGTAHNFASREMLYLSGSSGAQFDERARQLRGTEDIISAIEAAISER